MLKRKFKSLCFTVGAGFVLAGVSFPMTTMAAQNVTNEAIVEDVKDVAILNAMAGGTTADDCYWTLDKDYNLTISGDKGAVLHGSDASCWGAYRDQITSITIDVPVAEYISGMFNGYSKVKTIKAKIGKTKGSLERTFACYKNDDKPESALETVDLSGMNVSSVTSIRSLFFNCRNLKTVNVSNWNTSNMQDMSFAFSFCTSLKTVDLSKWNTSEVTNMSAMFQCCEELEKLNISKWDTSKVYHMDYMFNCCYALKSLDLSRWDTANVVSMNNMFTDCFKLASLDVSHFNTSKVKDMSYMFWECRALKSIDVSSFDTKNVTNVYRMFEYCHSLTSLDLSNFQLGKVVDPKNLSNFVTYCDNLMLLKTPKNVKVASSLTTGKKKGDYWYRDATNTMITELPKNQKVSISLHVQEKDNKVVDVRTTDWEYDAVTYVTKWEIMNGVGHTNDKQKYTIFKGKDTLTRGMFVQVLFNKEGVNVNPNITNPFVDVKQSDYFYNAVRWAYWREIVSGTSAKTFSPNEPIKRQDMVVIMYNYAWLSGEKYLSIPKNYSINSFKDHNAVSNYAVPAITWAVSHKIITGKPITGTKNYKLDPNGYATRSECAQILLNFDNYMKSVK